MGRSGKNFWRLRRFDLFKVEGRNDINHTSWYASGQVSYHSAQLTHRRHIAETESHFNP